jgi:hypothetical protein
MMDAGIQQELEQRIQARAFWDEWGQMRKEALGLGGALKKVVGLFRKAPMKPTLSPAEMAAKKFMAQKGALKAKPIAAPRSAGELTQRLQMAETRQVRPGGKYAAMRAEVEDLAERTVKVVQRRHDIVEAEPGSIHLTKSSAIGSLVARNVMRRAMATRATKVVKPSLLMSGAQRAKAVQQRAGQIGARQLPISRGSRSRMEIAGLRARMMKRKAARFGRTVARRAGPTARVGALAGGLALGGAALGGSALLRQHAEQQMGRRIPTPYRPA